MPVFTPVEQKILDLLMDGMSHSRAEIHACLSDELSDIRAIRPHITRIRKKIQPVGRDIMFIPSGYNGPAGYRLMRMLRPNSTIHDLGKEDE